MADPHRVPGRALVVCGPTAAGKSEVADLFAEQLSDVFGAWVPALLVDSMQVYREIPVLSNQLRRRKAELAGIVSVSEEWNVALHKERVDGLAGPLRTPFVLDAGTGMYLNAVLLDVPLAPRVPLRVREEAARLSADAPNPRRAAREMELELMEAPARSSIWSADLRYDACVIYLRPPRGTLDRNIAARSARIVRDGLPEARELSGLSPNPSVRDAVGVKEMLALARGEATPAEAQENVNVRTRRLARRQLRWFDKLVRHLPEERVRIVESVVEAPNARDIMAAWTR